MFHIKWKKKQKLKMDNMNTTNYYIFYIFLKHSIPLTTKYLLKSFNIMD